MVQIRAVRQQPVRVADAHGIRVHEYAHQQCKHLLHDPVYLKVAVLVRDECYVDIRMWAKLSTAVSARSDDAEWNSLRRSLPRALAGDAEHPVEHRIDQIAVGPGGFD